MDVMDNYKKVKKVLWIILIANMIVALIKVSIGTIIKTPRAPRRSLKMG
ncbi:hypothetical protein [Alkalibaculum bacchi]|nr:hypothetical protein [Alkalibaculum bacchi]